MTEQSLRPMSPGLTEKILRQADQAAASAPLCQTNLVCLLEFDLTRASRPSLQDLKNFIKSKLPEIPALTTFLEQKDKSFRWVSYQPDLDKTITEKNIGSNALIASNVLNAAVHNLLKSKIPYKTPWKLLYLTGYAKEKFALLWCVRHEIMDAGGLSVLLNALFGKASSFLPILPSLGDAAKTVPPAFLKLSNALPEASLFFKEISSTSERKRITLQMPSRLLPVIGKRFGVSGNDLYLAAMKDAFYQWRHHYPLDLPHGAKLPVIVPVNLRQPTDLGAGNRFYLKNINLSAETSPQEISEEMAIFRQKNFKESLAVLYAKNADIAFAQFPAAQCASTAFSSFRITRPMAWGDYPLLRMVQAFNAFVTGMPLYSMLSTYEPKNTSIKELFSTLFFSIDSGIEGLSSLPELWKESVLTHAQKAGIDLTPFGEDPIQPFN